METKKILLLVFIALLIAFVLAVSVILRRLHNNDRFFDERWRIYQKDDN